MKSFWIIFLLIALASAFYFLEYLYFGSVKGVSKTEYKYVKIGDRDFKLEIADAEIKRQKGLSGRDKLPENEGMIFLFDAPGRYQFWMKDMRFPLDIIWLKDGQIVDIVENAEPANDFNVPVYYPSSEADAVIEVAAGTVFKGGLKINDSLYW